MRLHLYESPTSSRSCFFLSSTSILVFCSTCDTKPMLRLKLSHFKVSFGRLEQRLHLVVSFVLFFMLFRAFFFCFKYTGTQVPVTDPNAYYFSCCVMLFFCLKYTGTQIHVTDPGMGLAHPPPSCCSISLPPCI